MDAEAIASTAARAGRGQLHDFPGDHFAPFTGAVTDAVIAAQVEFWAQQV